MAAWLSANSWPEWADFWSQDLRKVPEPADEWPLDSMCTLVAQQRSVSVNQPDYIASFPGRRRNGLATSVSSNCYCLKVGSTNQISQRSHMTTVKPNCLMH